MTEENILARYTIQRELGRGALGAVYAARDRTTGTVVALKRLDPALFSKADASFAERFLQQARAARRLEHAGIVRVLDAGAAAGTGYVAMELLEGESLRSILDRGPLPLARAIRIAHDVACGLAYAHLEGVVHGGLKPSNIIVLRSGAAKITDFGVAKLTPRRQAPDQPPDHRADVFALGGVLYEMLAHRPPPGDGAPLAPSELNPHVPRALDAVVLSMLAERPADRMAGIPVLLRELQRLQEGLGLEPDANPPAEAPAAPPRFEERAPPQEPPRFAAIEREREVLEYRRAMMERGPGARRRAGARPPIVAALALVLALVAIGLTGYLYYSSGLGERVLAAIRTREAPAPAPAAPIPAAPSPVAETPKVVEAPKEPLMVKRMPAAEPAALAPIENPVVREPEKPKPTVVETAPARAQLIVAVAPRGEIYIDGEHRGTSPPLTTLDLEPGMHRVEVRSGARKPFLTYMTVEPGDVRRIRHDFNAKPSRPPA